MGCYLTLVSCLKDEEDCIEDFVKYHRFVGVEKFVFFDRNYSKIKEIFKNDPDVDVIHFPEPRTHTEAWMAGIAHTQHQSFWTAFIDADEVIVPVKTNNVRDILNKYHGYASLQINWHTFGSSGLEHKTPQSMYEKFLMRTNSNNGVNNHTQSIVQPLFILGCPWPDPHHAPLSSGVISVNEKCIRVQGPFSIPPSHEIIWCGHYYTKSREEWAIKNAKGRADIPGHKIPFDLFDHYNTFCNSTKEERVLELWNLCNEQNT